MDSSIKVLVVGDWVVDENWLLTTYESDTSSHVGKEHFKSLVNRVDAQILSLCGAGNIARSLHGLSKMESNENNDGEESEERTKLEIFGLGFWHPTDTKLLASLFSNDIVDYQTPQTLKGMTPTGKSPIPRYSLCGEKLSPGICQDVEGRKQKKCPANKGECNYLKTLNNSNSNIICGTSRAVRQYTLSAKGDPELIMRTDWDAKINPLNEKDIKKLLTDSGWKDFSVIIVHDLHRGGITPELIQVLRRLNKNADWFVRTKDMHVDWVKKIPEEKFKMRMIGAEYIPNRSDTKRWFYGSEANIEAIKELEKHGLFSKIQSSDAERWVISLHNNNSMLALHRLPGDGWIKGVSIVDSSPPQPINVGRSSIVFASCIASILGCYSGTLDDESMLSRAHMHGYRWSKSCSKGFRDTLTNNHNGSSPVYYLRGDHIQAIKETKNSEDDSISPGKIKSFIVKDVKTNWEDSYKESGIVNGNEFHLWRGFSCVEGYVAIREKIRRSINEFYQAIQEFQSRNKDEGSLNCLILGRPGWGKTLLAEKLAEAFDLNPLFFNLSQLTSLEQVTDCFDEISSLQNQQRNRPVLAFFDEIDAYIGGNSTYSLFLAPILDGTYRRGGRVFHLKSCVWIFAGAEKLNELKNKEYEKFPDFFSRINGPIIELDIESIDKETREMRTEQVYLGVKLLRQYFNDISQISKDVLDFFYNIQLNQGVRRLAEAIKKFRNVQYGKVGRSNFPDFDKIKTLLDVSEEDYKKLTKTDKADAPEEEYIIIKEIPE